MKSPLLPLLLLPVLTTVSPAHGGNGWDDPELYELPLPELITVKIPPPPIHIPLPCEPCFEDLPLGSTYFWNDTFVTGPFKMVVAPIEWPGGPLFFGGRCLGNPFGFLQDGSVEFNQSIEGTHTGCTFRREERTLVPRLSQVGIILEYVDCVNCLLELMTEVAIVGSLGVIEHVGSMVSG